MDTSLKIEKIKKLADEVCSEFDIHFDEEGVRYIDTYINEWRDSRDVNENTIEKIQDKLGSYLGETMVRVYSGNWIYDQKSEQWAVEVKGSKAFPFNKVIKQVENGKRDSVYSLFKVFPQIFDKQVQ